MSSARNLTLDERRDEALVRVARRINYLNLDGCWLFEGPLNKWGYARVRVDNTTWPLHRFFYELFVGPIPEDLVIDHICRNRACVNPDHLQAITASENIALGRLRNEDCPKGHPLSGENLYVAPGSGWRQCRVCRKATGRRRDLRHQHQEV